MRRPVRPFLSDALSTSRPLPHGLLVLTLLFCSAPATPQSPPPSDRRQDRPAKVRVEVGKEKIEVDDGDTVDILWGPGDEETVRILGIDTPEIQHYPHNIPYDQSFGREALGFARGAFAVAGKVELLRADTKDPFGRTLGYLFLDGRNYSEIVIRARLAAESVSKFGDNGFPEEAAKMLVAAREAGPVPFENPSDFRQRMRAVSEWMKVNGRWPQSTE